MCALDSSATAIASSTVSECSAASATLPEKATTTADVNTKPEARIYFPTSTVTSAERPARIGTSAGRFDPRDAHRHALHDLDEVAGRVVGGQEREARPGAAREALDLALELAAREGVDRDLGLLPGSHLPDLRLLEVGDHVGRRRHQLDHRLADRDELPLVHRQLRGEPVGGREDLGVRELQLRQLERAPSRCRRGRAPDRRARAPPRSGRRSARSGSACPAPRRPARRRCAWPPRRAPAARCACGHRGLRRVEGRLRVVERLRRDGVGLPQLLGATRDRSPPSSRRPRRG